MLLPNRYSLRSGHGEVLLNQIAEEPDATGAIDAYLRVLQAIFAGSRERALADHPQLDFSMAAEIPFLIETLEKVIDTVGGQAPTILSISCSPLQILSVTPLESVVVST